MKFIYLLTLQHTGTWIAIYSLLQHPDVGGFLRQHRLEKALDGYRLTHKPLGCTIEPHEGFGADRTQIHVIQNHMQIRNNGLITDECLTALMTCPQVMIPMRDPLSALMTHIERRGKGGYPPLVEAHLDRWFAAFKIFEKLKQKPIAYFPVDLGNIAKRFVSALKTLGMNPQCAYDMQYPMVNTVGAAFEAKLKYKAGEKQWLKQHIGVENWDRLCDGQDKLRPLLESLGYRNLLWWS